MEPFVRDAVRVRVALLGSGGPSAAISGWPEAPQPLQLVAAVPVEEEVVAAELDILDSELELEAYICNKQARKQGQRLLYSVYSFTLLFHVAGH